jgi:hypothetical protein
MPELARAGWTFSIKDPEKFDRAHRAQLHRIGPERLRSRFRELEDQFPNDLVLACLEKNPAECHRSQISALWKRWFDIPIHDLAALTSRRGHQVALVHEVDQ